MPYHKEHIIGTPSNLKVVTTKEDGNLTPFITPIIKAFPKAFKNDIKRAYLRPYFSMVSLRL